MLDPLKRWPHLEQMFTTLVMVQVAILRFKLHEYSILKFI